MNILVTGCNGFVGRNLVSRLSQIRDGKDHSRPDLSVTKIYGIDTGHNLTELEEACKRADFVFHLAGVNRSQDQTEFMKGNCESVSILTGLLKKHHNTCPVMYAGSLQASLAGRFADSLYGKSKLAGERLIFQYAAECGVDVYVYRFPNLFGKWCRPGYHSVVATFCHAIANDLEYTVDDPDIELELVYIDDLVSELLNVLEGRVHRCEYPVAAGYTGLKAAADENGRYCYVPVTHHVTVGEIAGLSESFSSMSGTCMIPQTADGSFERKLFSTYLSFLPPSKMAFTLNSKSDERGIFTELFRTSGCGQISVNVVKPKMTRGQHWHNSKWEIFIVVSGHGLIQERRTGINPETDTAYPVIEFKVTGKQLKAVRMLPGYTHSITNLSETEDLIILIWANEVFDPAYPDTFFEMVAPRQE